MTEYLNVDPRDWSIGQVVELDTAPETVVAFYTGEGPTENRIFTIRLQTYDDMHPIYFLRVYNWDPRAVSLTLEYEDELGMAFRPEVYKSR